MRVAKVCRAGAMTGPGGPRANFTLKWTELEMEICRTNQTPDPSEGHILYEPETTAISRQKGILLKYYFYGTMVNCNNINKRKPHPQTPIPSYPCCCAIWESF